MFRKNCFEIADGLSDRYCFAYADSVESLAEFLFAEMKIDVKPEEEFGFESEPFKVVMCRVPRHQREEFMNAVDLLPALMDYVGITGYDDFCQELTKNAAAIQMNKKEARGNIPLQ
jgi:hypothetical protein